MISSLPTPPGPIWATDTYDWCTPEGLTRLQDILREKVPYEIAERQLVCTAKILMGQHVSCVWATGEGKSSVFYLYSLVRPATMTIVVSPTNALEGDMVQRLGALKIHALAVNHEALTAASCAIPPRNLWEEVKGDDVNIVLLSPEMLLSRSFKEAVQCKHLRSRLAVFCVDECHLIDEWGSDFRKAYGRIGDTIPWLPTWTARLALTATLEPGRQTTVVMKALGFHDDNFHFDRRDCERYNIDIVFCTMMHAYTTDTFHDLDWVIHPGITRPADVPKTLIYCKTIDLGHRLATYLRSRLSPSLQCRRNTIIHHAHSLNCPDCKTDILDALYQSGPDRTTALVIATDVLGVGMDVPDYDRVVCFPTPSCTSSMIQRIGRASRARDRHGTAYVYLKKGDIEAVTAYLETSTDIDSRFALLPSQSQVPLPTRDIAGRTQHLSRRKHVPKKLAVRIKSDSFIKNISLWAIVSAYMRNACIVRQINVIQGNPGVDHDCGRCTSCCSHLTPPLPPPTFSLPSMNPALSQPTDDVDTPAPASNQLPAFLKLKLADVERLSKRLQDAMFKICDEGPDRDDDLFIGYQALLDSRWITKITTQFMLITSKEILQARLEGWEYWDIYGDALWLEVERLVEELHGELKQRHEDGKQLRKERSQEKSWEEASIRKQLMDAGLGGIKRVTLLVRPSPVAPSSSIVDKENSILHHDDIAGVAQDTARDDANVVGSSPREPRLLSPKRIQPPLNADLTNTPSRRGKRQRTL